jgi:predicted aminopeptidase
MISRRTVRRLFTALAVVAAIVVALYALAWLAFADVRYVTRAAIEELRILRRRRSIAAVVADTTTDPRVRGKLLLVLAARDWANDSLGLAARESFTTYSALDRDTLVIVLSAARSDRLEAWTWTWPVVGRVPYKGFFSLEQAQREAQNMERAGLDTYLRPASAFSTLGWFNDPLLSTTLRTDSVDLAATVGKLYVRAALKIGFVEIVFVFLFVDLFDNVGTLVGVGTKAGLFDKPIGFRASGAFCSRTLPQPSPGRWWGHPRW